MLKGFKEFIAQGNALELAVAVIIGAAFSPIVKAITDVIMAMISQVVGQPNFDSVGQFKLTASATEFVQPGGAFRIPLPVTSKNVSRHYAPLLNISPSAGERLA